MVFLDQPSLHFWDCVLQVSKFKESYFDRFSGVLIRGDLHCGLISILDCVFASRIS